MTGERVSKQPLVPVPGSTSSQKAPLAPAGTAIRRSSKEHSQEKVLLRARRERELSGMPRGGLQTCLSRWWNLI